MSRPTFFELFAGAGGLSMGLERAGWECVAHCEIEQHARASLRANWRDVPLYGDVGALSGGRKMKRWLRARHPNVTLLTGGSPCQDLSVAGKRRGMAGLRSSLFFRQVRLWKILDCPLFLWENVQGALSSNKGEDFAAVLSAIVGSPVNVPADGWGGATGGGVVAGRAAVAAWRVFDARFFGVAQRRRRVFVVGARIRGFDPAEVLSLGESLSGYLTARVGSGESDASDIRRFADGGRASDEADDDGTNEDDAEAGERATRHARPVRRDVVDTGVAFAMRNREGKEGGGKGPLISEDASLTLATGNDQVISPPPSALGFHATSDVASPLTADADRGDQEQIVVAFEPTVMSSGQVNAEVTTGESPTLTLLHEAPIVFAVNNDSRSETSSEDFPPPRAGAVGPNVVVGRPRRLMPIECERLMGWPDRWTAEGIDEKGKRYSLSDSARYRLCGNGVVAQCTDWIGGRMLEELRRVSE